MTGNYAYKTRSDGFKMNRSVLKFCLGLLLAGTSPAWAESRLPAKWSEEAFLDNQREDPRFYIIQRSDDIQFDHSVIGEPRFYEARPQDTMLDIARFHSLGQTQLIDANPGLHRFGPPVGQLMLLPTQWVLPDVPYSGMRINIPEMRLYYFRAAPDGTTVVTTFPVGLGRDDWRTPAGPFKVVGKTERPTWVLPESVKKEWREQGKFAPASIPGGSPENPLGLFRLELSIPMYRIHGTNMPWGVGMQVSHGCVRLYPEDIARLFPMVPVGVQGEFTYQPVKVGARGGRIFIEVHKDFYNMAPDIGRQAESLLAKRGWLDAVDRERLERALSEQSGVATDITARPPGADIKNEMFRN